MALSGQMYTTGVGQRAMTTGGGLRSFAGLNGRWRCPALGRRGGVASRSTFRC
jgi:hypothetical protein